MKDAGLQTVFRAVVEPRLTYASPAWRGFITAPIFSESMRSHGDVSAVTTVHPICQTLSSWWKRQMNACSAVP